MKHYGDITKLSGYDLPPVDCITGGSPCQDLSVAGNRAGLAGERSGLFMEQIRIVKEMRQRDRESDGYFRLYPRPRFMVWENVPGAFSSNKGRDFQAVLTEIVRIVKADAPDVPLPDGGWSKSGCLMGYSDDGYAFSVAWRLHNAQFWGVAQRRRRIALVADFRGTSAPEILFERKGMSGNSEQSREKRQNSAGDTEKSFDGTSKNSRDVVVYNGENITSPLNKANPQTGDPCHTLSTDSRNYLCLSVENYPNDSRVKIRENGSVQTLNGHMGTGGNNVPLAMCADDEKYIIRRLTPKECERLQGFPDGWTDIGDWVDSKGKKHKGDATSPRYRALGNSIALPFWFWLLRRISAQYYRPATLGSLFDGIGGFPLCWERCNGPGTAIWASEIEEFPIAVTKKHFPE